MLSRRVVLSLVAVATLAGCNCGSTTPPPDGGTQCTVALDCPAPENPCRVATCTDGTCGFAPAQAGLVVADQVAGDCQVKQCDGVGNVVSVADAADVEDDANECTVDTCVGTAPNHTDAAAGTACGAGGTLFCDGAGACGGCNAPTDCTGQDTECQFRTCTARACGTGFAPQGTVTSAQTPGDCQQAQCDGQGAIIQAALATDVPADGNACTDDLCTGTAPSNPPVTAGSACADGGIVCDGAGACVGCNAATDCPGQDSFCRARTCTNHVCGFSDTAANTALPTQTSGDCRRAVCDGAGSTISGVDDTDLPVDGFACTDDVCSAGTPTNPPRVAGTTCGTGQVCDGTGQCVGCNVASDCPGQSSECATVSCTNHVCTGTFAPAGTALAMQTSGNCQRAVCDGAGLVTSSVDDADVPVDNLQCTSDVCTAGVPSNAPVSAGTTCTQSGGSLCNSTGQCVQCLAAADCGTATQCLSFVCNAGVCGNTYAPVGTVVSGQVAGNCRTVQCDGSGGTTAVVDNTDLPVDGLECTDDLCTAGTPSNAPKLAGVTCAQGGGVVCDGFGACVQCNTATDCSGATECRVATCTANTCGFNYTPAGTPVGTQVAGDCRQVQCDGVGATSNAVDDADLPVDGLQCTDDMCTAGTPSNPPRAQGTTCNQSGGLVCDATGTCVQCNVGSDCASGVCTSNVCQAATCTDTVRNGAETDVDCGGGTCPACAPTRACVAGTDCQTGVCTALVCQSPGVASTSPADGALGVPVQSPIAVTFLSAMNPATLTVQGTSGACTGSLQVSSDDFATCIGLTGPAMSGGDVTATVTASPALLPGTRYRVRVTTAAQDTFANPLGVAYSSATGFLTTTIGCGVVISQVYGGGGNSGAPYLNDFIELKNQGTSPVNLGGWSVQYASATGTTWALTALGAVTLQPGAYFLVRGASGGTVGVALPTPDAIGTLNMSGTAGKVALVAGTAALAGACPTSPLIVDLVGFGTTANCFEGAGPTPAPSNTTAVLRGGSGCTETNGNSVDFASGAPTPRNTASNAFSCTACGLQNETNAPGEADYCNVQFPASLTVAASTLTPTIYGQLWENGVTAAAGAAANVLVQLGWAPAGVNPLTQSGWQFFPATYNTQVGENDEYQGTFTSPAAVGSYSYTFRFSLDNGATWTYADLDGAGSNAGLTFDTAQLPVMTVQ